MAIEKIERLSGTARAAAAATTSTPIGSSRRDSSSRFRSRGSRIISSRTIGSRCSNRAASRIRFSDPRYAGAAILVVNANFGCGSSREHAPQAIRRWGIRAVVGESFSEIFFGNSVALGLPCVTVAPADADALIAMVQDDPSVELTVDLSTLAATAGGKTFKISMPAGARDGFLDGSWDATGLLLDRFEEVEAVAARLPYVTNAHP